MPPLDDHPYRYQLVNELHARPFPVLAAPCCAAFLALKPLDGATRNKDAERAHLIELLDRFGAAHPQPDATHYFGQLSKYRLKWESHTEFVTYTIFADEVSDNPFAANAFDMFPDEWLARAPGVRVTSALIHVELEDEQSEIALKVDKLFVSESLAISHVLDQSATVAGDFRIDSSGHMRFAVFVAKGTGDRRIGRIIQRLCEIETYKTMSMLGLTRVREIDPKLGELDARLTALMAQMRGKTADNDATLGSLLDISAELEDISARTSFRFGATAAYEAIVNQRIAVLREERFGGRQTFSEFMTRRYDPAMRTVNSAKERLNSLAQRALRAGSLLRTRIDVERSAQNQSLLASMDKRADIQLRLQRTVEGLSVVAVSYYAVNLAIYLLAPAAAGIGVTKLVLTAAVTPIVILSVWIVIRSLRRNSES